MLPLAIYAIMSYVVHYPVLRWLNALLPGPGGVSSEAITAVMAFCWLLSPVMLPIVLFVIATKLLSKAF